MVVMIPMVSAPIVFKMNKLKENLKKQERRMLISMPIIFFTFAFGTAFISFAMGTVKYSVYSIFNKETFISIESYYMLVAFVIITLLIAAFIKLSKVEVFDDKKIEELVKGKKENDDVIVGSYTTIFTKELNSLYNMSFLVFFMFNLVLMLYAYL